MPDFNINQLLADLLISGGKQAGKGIGAAANAANNLAGQAPSPMGFGQELLKSLLSSSEKPVLPTEPEEVEPGENEKIVLGLRKKQRTEEAKEAMQQAPFEQVRHKHRKWIKRINKNKVYLHCPNY